MPQSMPHVVMVVTESPTLRNHIEGILRQAGHRSVGVATAVEALHTLTDIKPELIFLEIDLPGMDGLDFCRLLKDNPYSKDIPVVMLSRSGEIYDEVLGLLVGATECLTKPFPPETILTCARGMSGKAPQTAGNTS